MAEFNDNDPQEPTLPSKRKLDPIAQDTQHLPTKSPKLASLEPQHSNDNTSQLPTSPSHRVLGPSEDANDDNQHQSDSDDENELDDDDDEEEDDVEEEPEVDRKGKGILRDDKGKGKMIVEEGEEEDDDDDDDSDDDDSDDEGSGSGEDSDFSDDPLAEVDLNNILPSRTRRRTAHSGVHIAGGDTGNAGGNDDDRNDSGA